MDQESPGLEGQEPTRGIESSRTSDGIELTDELIERLAKEAEEGYDIAKRPGLLRRSGDAARCGSRRSPAR